MNSVIVCDPGILGGEPVFRGTRVPYQALLDYIEDRHTLDEFLDDFPAVSREMAVRALEEAKQALVAREAAKRLAALGGYEPNLRPIPRRRSIPTKR